MRERGLQSGVALGDDQRVRVVGDVEQAGHAGLARATVVAEVQVGMLVEVPAQVHSRGDVKNLARHLRIFLAHVFIVERGALGQQVETYAEVVIVAHTAETQVDGLVVVAILAELAQAVGYGVGTVQHIVHVVHESQHGVDVVAVGLHALGQRLIGIAVVDEGAAVVAAVTVVVGVAHLQIGAVGDGFAVGQLSAQAEVARGRVVVAVVLLRRALRIVSDAGSRELLTRAVAVVALDEQRHVPSLVAQLAVQLQLAAQVGVRVDAHVAVGVRVDHHLHQLVAIRARRRIAAPKIA